MPAFNLVDEPWILCVRVGGGVRQEYSLKEALDRAPEIREIVDPSPLVTVALHRLLLAILHRNFGPSSAGEWTALWNEGYWDAERLTRYFDEWRGRFNLFDEHHPFYQARSLDFSYSVPISKLTHEYASGNNPTLFDHTTDDADVGLAPAEAARYLVAHQAFAVGGLVSLEKGQDPRLYKSADAAPLAKGAVAIAKGRNLFQTLMLNFHWYNHDDEEPFASQVDDCPAWERADETRAGDCVPRGYLDVLTWQSRRIRLQQDLNGCGEALVRRVVVMKGLQYPDGYSRHKSETMVAFLRNLRARSSEDPWPPVGFREDRALWRDSLALFQSVEARNTRPKMFSWLSDLCVHGAVNRSLTIPTDFYGLCTDKAKVLFWRHERLSFPLVYLEDTALLEKLRLALELAEKLAEELRWGVRRLATLLLAPNSDRPAARQPLKEDVNRLADGLTAERLYWPRLEVPFRELLVALAEDKTTVTDDTVEYGREVLPEWARLLHDIAVAAFAETTCSLDTSARTLKAIATAERTFYNGAYTAVRDYLGDTKEAMDESAD